MSRFTLLVMVRTVAFKSDHTPTGVSLTTTRLDFASVEERRAARDFLMAQDRALLPDSTRVTCLDVDNVLPEYLTAL